MLSSGVLSMQPGQEIAKLCLSFSVKALGTNVPPKSSIVSLNSSAPGLTVDRASPMSPSSFPMPPLHHLSMCITKLFSSIILLLILAQCHPRSSHWIHLNEFPVAIVQHRFHFLLSDALYLKFSLKYLGLGSRIPSCSCFRNFISNEIKLPQLLQLQGHYLQHHSCEYFHGYTTFPSFGLMSPNGDHQLVLILFQVSWHQNLSCFRESFVS
jgi:hypothetical protein